MRYIFLFLTTGFVLGCTSLHNVEEANITIEFTHNWDGDEVNNTTFGNFLYQTANGQELQIDRLQYVVSQLRFIGNTGVDFLNQNYNLVDVGEGDGLSLTIKNVIPGTYSLGFRFGFADADNLDGVYPDLNSVSFNVPSMLGGGYHYMQFDGKYKDIQNNDVNFNYHVIRAADISNPSAIQTVDTSFEVNLGTVTIKNDATISVEMNVAEWFKNPNLWDLNLLDVNLMSNYNAQLLMNQNGKSVFSLGKVTQ